MKFRSRLKACWPLIVILGLVDMASGRYRTLFKAYKPTNGPQADGSIGTSLGPMLFSFWGLSRSIGAQAVHDSVQREEKITHRIETTFSRCPHSVTDDLILVASGWEYKVRRIADFEGDDKLLHIEVEMTRTNG